MADNSAVAVFAKMEKEGVLPSPEVKKRVEAFLEKISVHCYGAGEMVEYRDACLFVEWALRIEGRKGPTHISASGDKIIFYKARWEVFLCEVDSIDYGRDCAKKCGLEITHHVKRAEEG